MSKRRFQAPEAREPEALTPEERRAQRRRDRAKRKAGRAPSAAPRWRKAALIGIPSALIVAIAAALIVLNLPTPCLQFTPIPGSSPGAPNEPTFPTSSQSGFSGTWCISSTPVYSTSVDVRIAIGNTTVSIPGLIGERTNYSAGVCDLPIHTLAQPPPPGVVQLDSPWPYQYNLSMFFNVWSQSFSHVYVDASHPNQPIVYQRSDILGYTSNSTFSVNLFVDNQPSRSGPDLDMTTLAYSVTNPSCLGKVYGSGHTILISYAHSGIASFGALLRPATLATGLADPTAVLRLFDGPLPHLGLEVPMADALARIATHGLPWLVLRVAG